MAVPVVVIKLGCDGSFSIITAARSAGGGRFDEDDEAIIRLSNEGRSEQIGVMESPSRQDDARREDDQALEWRASDEPVLKWTCENFDESISKLSHMFVLYSCQQPSSSFALVAPQFRLSLPLDSCQALRITNSGSRPERPLFFVRPSQLRCTVFVHAPSLMPTRSRNLPLGARARAHTRAHRPACTVRAHRKPYQPPRRCACSRTPAGDASDPCRMFRI